MLSQKQDQTKEFMAKMFDIENHLINMLIKNRKTMIEEYSLGNLSEEDKIVIN